MIYEITERVETGININKQHVGGTLYITAGFKKIPNKKYHKIIEKIFDLFDHTLVTNNPELANLSDRYFLYQLNIVDEENPENVNKLFLIVFIVYKMLLYRQYDYAHLLDDCYLKYIKITFKNTTLKFNTKDYQDTINHFDLLEMGSQMKELDELINKSVMN